MDSENSSTTCGPLVVDLTNVGDPTGFDYIAAPFGTDFGPGSIASPTGEVGFGASGAEKRSKVITCKPNPVTGTATFTINLATGGPANLDVYDVSGRKVATVLDRNVTAGGDSVTWRPTVAAGIYVYVLEADGRHYVGKVAVAR
jgi:hypothetical protein